MELQQLRYAVALAEELNFTRAAARCHVVQSALSHQIKALEGELGVALFARTSRRVELTAAGAAFLPGARASIDAAERAASDAAAAVGRVTGTLTVGVIPTVSAIDVPAALRAFRTAHPEVRLAVRGGGSAQFEAAIAAGRLDVAFLGLPPGREPRGVAWRHLATDTLVAVLPREHGLAGRQELALRELADDTFADFPAGTPARAQSDLAFTAAGIPRDVAFEATEAVLTLDLVRHGLAVTLLPSRALPADPALVAVPLRDGPTRDEYLAWSTLNPSPAARAFLAALDRPAPATTPVTPVTPNVG